MQTFCNVYQILLLTDKENMQCYWFGTWEYTWFLVQLDLWIHPKYYSKPAFAYRTDVLQQAMNRRITRPKTSVKLPIFHGTFMYVSLDTMFKRICFSIIVTCFRCVSRHLHFISSL
jgi:hypothetical protein